MRHLILIAAASFAAHGQTPSRFAVASVKTVQPSGAVHGGYGSEAVTANPSSLTMRNMRLRGLIKWAYDVSEHQIAGPAWLGSPGWRGPDLARFEVVAKASGDAAVPELRKMLQSLLAERFQLSLRRENRESPVFVMTAAKAGAGLKPATDANGESKCEGRGPTLICENTRLSEFVELLAGPLRAPIVDETGNTARHNFTLGAPDMQPGEDPIPAIIRSIQDELGVKLEKSKRAVEMLVIERLEKSPTEN
jgi:uncharacterized protein (TIGR03435 family)